MRLSGATYVSEAAIRTTRPSLEQHKCTPRNAYNFRESQTYRWLRAPNSDLEDSEEGVQ